MKKIRGKIEPTTYGDTRAGASLSKIAENLSKANDHLGMKFCRKAFKILSTQADVSKIISRIDKRYRDRIYKAYFISCVAPEIKKVTESGYKHISSHSLAIMNARKKINFNQKNILEKLTKDPTIQSLMADVGRAAIQQEHSRLLEEIEKKFAYLEISSNFTPTLKTYKNAIEEVKKIIINKPKR